APRPLYVSPNTFLVDGNYAVRCWLSPNSFATRPITSSLHIATNGLANAPLACGRPRLGNRVLLTIDSRYQAKHRLTRMPVISYRNFLTTIQSSFSIFRYFCLSKLNPNGRNLIESKILVI